VDQRGDELQGLVWAVLYAGANAVMATLWPVDDAAAMVFAHRFYTHLHDEGISLAEAYQAALQDLQMRRYMGTKLNPFFWAPFVLYGNGWQKDPLSR
jgi:CHAT domain-containing protein